MFPHTLFREALEGTVPWNSEHGIYHHYPISVFLEKLLTLGEKHARNDWHNL